MTERSEEDLIDVGGYPVAGVASVKGGCGRSLIAGYLALELAHRFPSAVVYLVDLDLGTPGQYVLFKISEREGAGFPGTSNLKAEYGAAIRDQNWDDILDRAIDLRQYDTEGELFHGLRQNEGRIRLVSGPGIETKKISDFRELRERTDSNLVRAIRAAVRDKAEGPAITILDLDAGLDGETPAAIKECDEKILVVRPDRQHADILADDEIRRALIVDKTDAFLENLRLVFNFVPEGARLEDVLDDKLRKLGYEDVLVNSFGRFDMEILRDERFCWPIHSAFQQVISELANVFDYTGEVR